MTPLNNTERAIAAAIVQWNNNNPTEVLLGTRDKMREMGLGRWLFLSCENNKWQVEKIGLGNCVLAWFARRLRCLGLGYANTCLTGNAKKAVLSVVQRIDSLFPSAQPQRPSGAGSASGPRPPAPTSAELQAKRKKFTEDAVKANAEASEADKKAAAEAELARVAEKERKAAERQQRELQLKVERELQEALDREQAPIRHAQFVNSDLISSSCALLSQLKLIHRFSKWDKSNNFYFFNHLKKNYSNILKSISDKESEAKASGVIPSLDYLRISLSHSKEAEQLHLAHITAQSVHGTKFGKDKGYQAFIKSLLEIRQLILDRTEYLKAAIAAQVKAEA